MRALLPWVDVFLPNEAEACAIADVESGDALAAARKLQAVSGGWVVVKLGARGSPGGGTGRRGAERSGARGRGGGHDRRRRRIQRGPDPCSLRRLAVARRARRGGAVCLVADLAAFGGPPPPGSALGRLIGVRSGDRLGEQRRHVDHAQLLAGALDAVVEHHRAVGARHRQRVGAGARRPRARAPR